MDNRKKILFVGNFISYKTKIRQVCEELAEKLVIAGWSVLTTSTKISRINRLYDMINTIILNKLAYKVAHVDVFSGLSFFWAETACLSLRLVGRPYVLTLHGGNLPSFGRRWPRRLGRLLQSAVRVTTPSEYLLKEMQGFCPNLLLMPNPLDLPNYSFRPRPQPQARLVWLRAFHNIYNPNLAPRVLVILATQFPDVHLSMIGPDKGDGSRHSVHQLANDLRIGQLITFRGPVPKAEVPFWLNQGDIFINTTNIDNTPVSVMEAMACGLCIVSTDVGGMQYLLTHEHDALLVPANDPNAMAGAVRRILTEPGLAEHLSRNARKKAEQYDWSIILPQWEALLLSIIEQSEYALKNELVS